MIYEERDLSTGFIRTTDIAFIFDTAQQYPNYPSPYILCQKWVKPDLGDMGAVAWVKVPVISPHH